MIFIAIPLATVGGVLSLWVRDMPFSVSAGVGFIALFGIAVLNGIVLIEHLKALKQQDFKCMKDLIFKGTKDRLRPVLLTAGTDALGFLPMAVSVGAGAEIQRPLATVVIGGLVTSTMLTLIALPILFELFHNVRQIKFFPFRLIRSKICLFIAFLFFVPVLSGFTQKEELNLQQITEIAIENNSRLNAYKLKIKQSEAMAKTTFTLPKTEVNYGSDQNNIADNGYPLNVLGIEQEMEFPTVYISKNKAKDIEVSMARTEFRMERNQLIKDVSISYFEYQMLNQQLKIYSGLDSIYERLLIQAEKRMNIKDASKLEYLNNRSKKNEISVNYKKLESKLNIVYQRLKILINYSTNFTVPETIEIMPRGLFSADSIPVYNYIKLQSDLAVSRLKVEKNNYLPDLRFNYFIGTNNHTDRQNYHGFEVGVAVPLFYGSTKNNVKTAKLAYNAQLMMAKNDSTIVTHQLSKLIAEQKNHYELIEIYRNAELPLVEEITRTATKDYDLKEINFLQFARSIESVIQIEFSY
jgi:cobalt-zinc-cadmium resistance protein CzcA